MDDAGFWEHYRARLEGKVTREAFLARMAAHREAFEGLLDDETIALLILDEEGLNEGAVVTLKDARSRAEATVLVQVEQVLPVREFQKEKGTGRVANVTVHDATGEGRLVLWDRDADKAEDGTLRAGDRVKVVNARVKDTRFGLELHVGPWSVLEVEGAPDKAKMKLLTDTRPDADPTTGKAVRVDAAPAQAPSASLGPARQTRLMPDPTPPPAARAPAEPVPGEFVPSVAGVVRARSASRTFRRKDGSVGFVADLEVEVDGRRWRVACWDECAKAAQGLGAGDAIEATALQVREWQGKLEYHTTRNTRLEKTG